jgi:hypothetical protein
MSHESALYNVERGQDDPEIWRVVGPNGVVGDYRSEGEAQARADRLNEDAAEEQEDDN